MYDQLYLPAQTQDSKNSYKLDGDVGVKLY